jgi:hypothetical protein
MRDPSISQNLPEMRKLLAVDFLLAAPSKDNSPIRATLIKGSSIGLSNIRENRSGINRDV